ncbi:hypothetical protein [uncultured Flavobacterium sp.]|uniref:hypothetical protein n=1 Tax=uncultured Flavobacterium sp. TaxID=165435 RepID=UPI0025FD5E39|nr:hypothetical protein [uncultured Flavobacterium sp.]
MEKNNGFDLEKINFKEDVFKLFSENLVDQDGFKIDSITKNTFSDTIFKYKIESYLAEEFKLNLPEKEIGFLYETSQTDSIASIQNVFFNKLYVLTNLDKKPIAYYAETRFKTKKEKDQFIANFKAKNGATKYEFLIGSHFNQCSYEWDLNDRTIQIETSKGTEMSISTNEASSIEEYYRLDMLIIENKFKKAIYEAHLLKLPEKFSIKGKIDTSITYTEKNLKELNLEKVNIVKDEFLLNSYFDEYVKDEYGTHQISAED